MNLCLHRARNNQIRHTSCTARTHRPTEPAHTYTPTTPHSAPHHTPLCRHHSPHPPQNTRMRTEQTHALARAPIRCGCPLPQHRPHQLNHQLNGAVLLPALTRRRATTASLFVVGCILHSAAGFFAPALPCFFSSYLYISTSTLPHVFGVGFKPPQPEN